MIKTIDPNTIPQPELYSILSTAVAPRPICFASTVDAAGNVNLSPFSFFNVFSSNPPVMVFSPARSGRDNSLKHTHQNVVEVPEVVINVVNHAMAEQMSLSSTAYDKGVNEFVKAGFTEVPSVKVKPPRVGEAPVSFECTVLEVVELAQTPGAGNLIIAQVDMIHVNDHYFTNGVLDTEKLDLVGRMGGNWYIRAIKESLFEIPKPIRTHGIGVDALPKGIRESDVLTGNNLGRLGNLENVPSSKEIKAIVENEGVQNASKTELHTLAKQLLEDGDAVKAMAYLLFAERL
ncbi:flavin reductase family protein [Flagellimonas halotolerans]|uniref:Flavin reductase family protein n=1 Tax=Flagellimonas halotolerans TaxID=3112164 RepID=A0ABU6IMJ2_9FLAO|nr:MULTISPECIES: flavin reductase family protein [unclassified Allomuricauda]MEC3964386.1 flavin reductase family protein [Muricauda sp. SYSU M86414]MEC4264256.1 flavin reductase family protein [Muricauda sp. SYSU M84420]